jgi:hypothetical protein
VCQLFLGVNLTNQRALNIDNGGKVVRMTKNMPAGSEEAGLLEYIHAPDEPRAVPRPEIDDRGPPDALP